MGEKRKGNPNWEPVHKGGRVVGYRKKSKVLRGRENLPSASSIATGSMEEDLNLDYGNLNPHIASHLEQNGVYPGEEKGTYVTPNDLVMSNLNTRVVGNLDGSSWRQYGGTLTDPEGRQMDVVSSYWESKADKDYFMRSMAKVESLPEPVQLEGAGFKPTVGENYLEENGHIISRQVAEAPGMTVRVESMHVPSEELHEFREGGKEASVRRFDQGRSQPGRWS